MQNTYIQTSQFIHCAPVPGSTGLSLIHIYDGVWWVMTQQGKNAIDLVLAESLIELSAKKTIDKITIKEMCIRDSSSVAVPW